MKKILLFTLLSIPIFKGYSQEVLWEKTIGGEKTEFLFDMVPTLDYGFLLAGSSVSKMKNSLNPNNLGNLDYFLWKMDKDGEEEWNLSFGGEEDDILKSITPTDDMGYILGGYSKSNKNDSKSSMNKGFNDIWIVKIDIKGQILWEKSFGGKGDDLLVEIKQTKDKGYIIIGTSNTKPSEDKSSEYFGGIDFWIIKTDSNGKLEWEKSYGGIYNDIPKTINILEDGFIIGGISNSPHSGNKLKDHYGGYDIWILELDNKGNKIKEYVFGSENDDNLSNIIATKGHFIITGNTLSEGEKGNINVSTKKENDLLVIKTDANFESVEQFVYDFKGDEKLTSTHLLENNNLLLSGYSFDNKKRTNSYIAIEIASDGEEIWRKQLSTDGDDILQKSTVTRDGDLVLAGNSTGKNIEYKRSVKGGEDYWIVKLAKEEKSTTNEIVIEAFPNPTDGISQIVVNHEYKEGELNIFDLNGKLLYNESIKYGMVPIDITSYPTGIYIINIKTDVYNGSVKVIKN